MVPNTDKRDSVTPYSSTQHSGYDRGGHDHSGYHHDGYDRYGYDRDGNQHHHSRATAMSCRCLSFCRPARPQGRRIDKREVGKSSGGTGPRKRKN